MTRLFRSKSCGLGQIAMDSVFDSSPHSSSLYLTNDNDEDEDEDDDDDGLLGNSNSNNPVKTPLIMPERRNQGHHQFPIVAILVAALRKSLVTCSVETEDLESSMDIGWPTNVRHVSHVTFDRFNGFLGLPVELEPEVPRKAWFRELPAGVLDCLTPEQVMHCNTEDECTQLVKLLPPSEAALLDWAINLMADVVQHEHHNKMNVRNIAMVFAPNMTQMADPLTALIHAVQVMNFLKTLIMKTLREREESAATVQLIPFCAASASDSGEPDSSNSNSMVFREQTCSGCVHERPGADKLWRSATLGRLESDAADKFWSFKSNNDAVEAYESISCRNSPVMCKRETIENCFRERCENEEVEGILHRLSLRKGVRKLCRHPVFQLTKPVKKSGGLGIVDNRRGGGEAWA
ncbi:unnamed protein product [Ilex paraguariensis]|uniref:Uncharacterized protein n=1 Tax=Ilex paraguariensis TaxID=185542 RepID=A0ABC8RFA2_9AQUA